MVEMTFRMRFFRRCFRLSWRCALALTLLLMDACSDAAMALLDPDPGLSELALRDVSPDKLVPGSALVLSGRGLPSPGDGVISLLLSGTITPSGGPSRNFAVRLPAEYLNATTLRVFANGELFAALGVTDGMIDAHATLVVDSAIDWTVHRAPPLRVRLEVARVLAPRLDSVELAVDPKSSKVHPNDFVMVRGDDFLLGGTEGQTVAVLDGCFLDDGLAEPCTAPGGGQLLRGVEVPILPVHPLNRRLGIFPYSPRLHGIRPGRFWGTVALKNKQTALRAATRSDPVPVFFSQVLPELRELSPAAASLGQYVELLGAGFVGDQPGQATLLRLVGQFRLEDSPLFVPFDLDVVVKWLPRYPDGPVGRYVLDETDALGQALEPRGGLRQAAGTFTGTASLLLRDGKDSVKSPPVSLKLGLAHVKQLVLVRFLPSYMESLRLFGLRAADRAVRARVLSVAQRDYAGINIEFREALAETPPPSDFALYTIVDIGGSDPNGLGYLGYDNTPGRDRHNQRLYDRIGGVNAVTQNDGSPGYGGVFTEQLLGFSAHPGHVEKLNVKAEESALFDRLFDPLRPDTAGTPASVAEVALVSALSDGHLCPADASARPQMIACAIFVLGNLIGTTMTHELGHSLGLANPENPNGSYHNNGHIIGRIMNAGSLRSFRERAELENEGPAVFCDTDYAYLQRILPLVPEAPGPPFPRPPCLD